MMLAVFALMTAALALGWSKHEAAARASLVLCFLLAIALFLFEIWSPEYGFRMPWISVDVDWRINPAPIRVQAC